MCGRFAQGEFPTKLRKIMREILDEIYTENYNTTPGEAAGIVVLENNHAAVAKRLEWGLIPAWNPATRLINARSETVAVKPSFRVLFQHHRCLVPALGFYEWQRGAGEKIPFYFSAADEERPVVMGGIWEGAHFSILTTAANETMSPIHNRMPVILPPEDWLDWLNPQFNDIRHLTTMMNPVPADYLHCWRVSRHVNNPKNKGMVCAQSI